MSDGHNGDGYAVENGKQDVLTYPVKTASCLQLLSLQWLYSHVDIIDIIPVLYFFSLAA